MKNYQEFLNASSNDVFVRGFLHLPAGTNKDCLVLTHGAGANCSSPLLLTLAEEFCAAGLMVLRCDLPFRQLRPHGPPPRGSSENDQRGLRAAVSSMHRYTSGRVFLGGHSYGGRQASMLAASEPGLVDRLLMLSYPLHPPQRPSELRTGHFPKLQTPALFVHGTRDGFGSIEEVRSALKLITTQTELLSVTDGRHDLLTKQNRDELPKMVAKAFLLFTREEAASN